MTLGSERCGVFMQRLDGKPLSSIFRLAEATAAFRSQTGTQPKLTVISVGEDPASKVYVGQKQKRALEIGYLRMGTFASRY